MATARVKSQIDRKQALPVDDHRQLSDRRQGGAISYPPQRLGKAAMVNRSIGWLAAVLFASVALGQSPYASDLSFRPSEGIWWSSAEPGTGVGFNMDSDGRWFAAIYLYTDDGQPAFLTMQGESLAYAELDRPNDQAWAIAASPLIRSEGGQCPACPWRPAGTSDTGDDAEIRFFGRNRAELRVGDWALQLTPLTVTAHGQFDIARPTFNRHYLLTGASEAGGLAHVLVVRLRETAGFTGFRFARLECVDCLTVGIDGEPDAAVDDALRMTIEAMGVACGPGFCDLTADFEHVGHLFVDKSGRFFSTIDTRPAPDGAPPNVIKLQLLDEGWR